MSNKRRIINLRLVLLAGLMFVVGFGAFMILSKSSTPEVPTTIYVASRFLTPGMTLTETDLLAVDVPMASRDYYNQLVEEGYWQPGWDDIIYPETFADVIAAAPMVVNTRYPGDEIKLSDLYVPSAVAGYCETIKNVGGLPPVEDEGIPALPGDGTLDVPALPDLAVPGPSASPLTTEPVNGLDPNVPLRFAFRLTDLLCDGQRAIALESDPTSTFARAGDMVTIFLLRTIDDGYGGTHTEIYPLMTRKLIYVIDRVLPADPLELNEYVPSGTTLIMDLDAVDAQKLLYAESMGDLRLSLARPGDETLDSELLAPILDLDEMLAGAVIDRPAVPLGDDTYDELTIITDPQTEAYVGEPFLETFEVGGATGPVTWTLNDAELLPGLTWDEATATISGVPEEPAEWEPEDMTVYIEAIAGDEVAYYSYLLSLATPDPAAGPIDGE